MNFPTSLKTSRVREAVTSLADYVATARDLAGGVTPVSVVTLPTSPSTFKPRPEPDTAVFDASSKTVTVSGRGFGEVDGLRLKSVTDAKAGSIDVLVTSLTRTDKHFTATLPNTPPDGRYLVQPLVKGAAGGFTFVNIASGQPPAGTLSCEIAAVVPTEAIIMSVSGVRGFTPREVFLSVTSEKDGFPKSVKFASASPAKANCTAQFPTGDPRVWIIRLQIIKPPGKGSSAKVKIKASAAKLKGEIDFNILSL